MHNMPSMEDGKTKDKSVSVSTASTVLLIFLMFVYLMMTLWSSSQLAGHIDVISGHPFEVVAAAGDLKTHVSEMRTRMERLMTHNGEADVQFVREALASIYLSLQEPLKNVEELYLGDAQNVVDLKGILDQLKTEQAACLDFAVLEDSDRIEIEDYETRRLYPLYDRANGELEKIIRSAQTKKVEYGQTAERLRKGTLVGSFTLMGLMVGVLLLSQHVLRKQRRELELRSRLFDNLSNSIDDAFLIRDVQTEEIYYTALNTKRVLGYSVRCLDDVYQGFRPEDAEEIRAILRSGTFDSPLTRVVEYTLPSQEKRWVSVRVYRAEHRDKPQYISVFSDCTDEITSRRALQDAMLSAERANTAKGEFLSRMSHEIRTPLNAIIGMTTIAAASVRSPEKVEDCLTKINFSSKHLLMLVNDVLDMSKIESNKMSLQKEPFDLFQVINGFVSTIYAQAKAKGVAFSQTMEGFEGKTQYLGDSLRLNQILLNLGSNAVKFTPLGGTITLTVSRLVSRHSTDTLRFVLQDTGIGMSPESLNRICKPFEQADASIASRYGGTGLGMSITMNLVTLMSGHIDIKSELGKGSTFTVDLPLLRDEEVREQPDFANLGLRALVVDDERAVCVETASLLEKIKIQAQWVLTGEEAVERVVGAQKANEEFDFCLIDWMIPDMDGIEVTRRIRASVGPGLPIVMISAYDCSEIEEEARAAGANAFLPKPLYLSSVYTTIKEALDGQENAERLQMPDQTNLRGKRMLVAEDNELNREIVEELLSMNGMETECVMDGRAALEAFENAPPGYFDAILMDVQMPVMNGYEAARCIRTSGHPDAKSIPIIATTANAFSDDISAALAAGMNTHVSKPIDIEQLCHVLTEEISGD